jgi:hypothetical protein
MVTVEGAVVVATCGAIVSISRISSVDMPVAGVLGAGGSSNQGTACAEASLANNIAARSRELFFEANLIIMAFLFSLRI